MTVDWSNVWRRRHAHLEEGNENVLRTFHKRPHLCQFQPVELQDHILLERTNTMCHSDERSEMHLAELLMDTTKECLGHFPCKGLIRIQNTCRSRAIVFGIVPIAVVEFIQIPERAKFLTDLFGEVSLW